MYNIFNIFKKKEEPKEWDEATRKRILKEIKASDKTINDFAKFLKENY